MQNRWKTMGWLEYGSPIQALLDVVLEFSDADFGQDVDTWKANFGYVFVSQTVKISSSYKYNSGF